MGHCGDAFAGAGGGGIRDFRERGGENPGAAQVGPDALGLPWEELKLNDTIWEESEDSL